TLALSWGLLLSCPWRASVPVDRSSPRPTITPPLLGSAQSTSNCTRPIGPRRSLLEAPFRECCPVRPRQGVSRRLLPRGLVFGSALLGAVRGGCAASSAAGSALPVGVVHVAHIGSPVGGDRPPASAGAGARYLGGASSGTPRSRGPGVPLAPPAPADDALGASRGRAGGRVGCHRLLPPVEAPPLRRLGEPPPDVLRAPDDAADDPEGRGHEPSPGLRPAGLAGTRLETGLRPGEVLGQPRPHVLNGQASVPGGRAGGSPHHPVEGDEGVGAALRVMPQDLPGAPALAGDHHHPFGGPGEPVPHHGR